MTRSLRVAFSSGLLALSAVLDVCSQNELTLPADIGQALERWTFSTSAVRVVQDPVAQAPAYVGVGTRIRMAEALFTARDPVGAPCVLEAEVRLPAEDKVGTISRGRVSLGLVNEATNRWQVSVGKGRVMDEMTYYSQDLRFTPVYGVKDISPLMDENVRQILERRIDQYLSPRLRVHRLRVEARAESLRMYVNGRLVREMAGKVLPARPFIQAVVDGEILACRVRPLESAAEAYVTVPLDDHCNAREPGSIAGVSREPGRVSVVEGVPFVAPAGPRDEDHLDLAPSLFLYRMGTMREADSRECVNVPENLDCTRFTLRVPAKPYRRAWVLAAFDGDPLSTPVLTIRFYKPRTPWNVDQAVEVPAYEASSAPKEARRLAFEGTNGLRRSLWMIPVELDAAALAAEPMDCLELTKAILPYRGWPDPAYYGAYPGGLPSGVHVYGLTLETAPVRAWATGKATGNLYTAPEKPAWIVKMRNLTGAHVEARVKLAITDPYGNVQIKESHAGLPVDVPLTQILFEPKADTYGLYQVKTEVAVGDFVQSREGAFLYLPENTRQATPENSPWGLWNWNAGGHGTGTNDEENIRLNKALGAINNYGGTYEQRKAGGIGSEHFRLIGRDLAPWSGDRTVDVTKASAYAEEKGKETAAQLKANPDLKYVNVFAENALSLRLTHGMPPWAIGQPPFEPTAQEDLRLRQHWETAKAAAAGVRKEAAGLRFIFGHGAACFALPFFDRPDWDNDRFDGFGMDLPQFERMPERQPRATEPSLLYFLHQAMRQKGMTNKEIVHLESYFPPTGPMALTPREQADLIVRTAVLSMSLGTTKFMRTWGLFTSGDGWGGSHYGSPGLIDRAPEFNPKPAAAAFATMTRVLDLARYEGWLETGSRSAYCLKFRDKDRLVYAVWTVRGSRPLTLAAEPGTELVRVDWHGNAFPLPLQGDRATVTLEPTVQWLVAAKGGLASASVGQPVYTEAPAPVSTVAEDFEKADWTYVPGPYERYQTNHWDMPREPGKMESARVASADRGSTVFRVKLVDPPANKPMVGFFGVFEPPKPIAIPGKAKALGLWVNGRSAWNRFVYQIEDAKGEAWINIGTKDAWNCDDIHSWSSVNHDGWRYMRFPLPGNAPGDNYRSCDNAWWGSDAEGVVDLPVRLTRLMVEMRPQMIYADQMLPVPDLSLEFDDLTVEYEKEADRTEAPAALQKAASKVLDQGDLAPLPNPHVNLQTNGLVAPAIDKVYPPEGFYNGTRLVVEIKPVAGAKVYKGYVSAHPDGRGAKALAINQQAKNAKFAALVKAPNIVLFDGLRPASPMYIFVTYADESGRESKPSAIREVVLKDEFPFK